MRIWVHIKSDTTSENVSTKLVSKVDELQEVNLTQQTTYFVKTCRHLRNVLVPRLVPVYLMHCVNNLYKRKFMNINII